MKKLFSTRWSDSLMHFWLLIYRILISVFMLTHAWPKALRLFSGAEISFADPIGIGAVPSLVLAVFSELICSVLIIFGLGTRLATIPLIVTMAVAAFVVHGADPFAKKEMALLYLVAYIGLLISGPGKFSVDKYLKI